MPTTTSSSRSRYYNLSTGSSMASSSLPTNTNNSTSFSRSTSAMTPTTMTTATTTATITTTSASTVPFDDPDRHHPISYSFLVVMGLLVMLPALVAYTTLEQSLQRQQVCFVGPAQPSPQARRRWTLDDYQQRQDFLQPLYGIYQLSQESQPSSEQEKMSKKQTLSQKSDTNQQVLRLSQSSSMSRLPQPTFPSMAKQFWSVTTLATTLTAKATTPISSSTTTTSKETSAQHPTKDSLTSNLLQWDQQELKSAERARKQASTNNRWCLVPSLSLSQVFAMHHKRQRQKPAQQQQPLPNFPLSPSASSQKGGLKAKLFRGKQKKTTAISSGGTGPVVEAYPHRRRLEQQQQQQQQQALNASVTKRSNFNQTTSIRSKQQQLQQQQQQKLHDVEENEFHELVQQPQRDEITRYQICSKMEPSLLLPHVPPFEWPMKPPPNGIWNQYEVIFPKSKNAMVLTRTNGGMSGGGGSGVDDDVAMALPYLVPSHQPMQLQVLCFMEDMNSMDDLLASTTGKRNQRNLAAPHTSSSSTFVRPAETPVTWLLIIILIWQQCTYRRQKRRSSKSKRHAQESQHGRVPSAEDEASLSTPPSAPGQQQQQQQRRRRNRFGWQSRHHAPVEPQSRSSSNQNGQSHSHLNHYLVNRNSRKESRFSDSTQQEQQQQTVNSLVVTMYEQWVHNSWKELAWNAVWLYMVASRLERDYLGGLVLLAVYITFGWCFAILRLTMIHLLGGHYSYKHHDYSHAAADEPQDGRSLSSSWSRLRSKASRQHSEQTSDPTSFTEMGQVGILIGLVVLLAQQQSSFSMFGIWSFDSFPLITPENSPPFLHLSLLPAVVIAPYVLLMFPTGKDYITLFFGTLIPAVVLGWIMSSNFIMHAIAAPQWVIPVTLLVHLMLVRWSPKLVFCYIEEVNDLEYQGSRNQEEDFQPLFLNGYNPHDARGPSDDHSGQWTLTGGSGRSVVKYQKQLKNDDPTVMSASLTGNHNDESVYKRHMAWSEFFTIGAWIAVGGALSLLPWFWSVQMDVSLLVGDMATSLLFIPILYYSGVVKRASTSTASNTFLHLCHQYHIVAALTLVVVQVMTLAAWNVAHVAMMSASSSNTNEQALPQEEQILSWWSWSQTVLSNSKFASSMGGGSSGDDNVMNRVVAGGISDSLNASSDQFHFGASLILAELCLIIQLVWHWMSLLVTASKLKHHQRIAKRLQHQHPANEPQIFGGDSRDVGLWFALQVVAEECRLWYHAILCR